MINPEEKSTAGVERAWRATVTGQSGMDGAFRAETGVKGGEWWNHLEKFSGRGNSKC